MQEKIKLIREYVNKSYNIDCGKLNDKDVVTLARFYLNALNSELPRLAKSDSEKLGLDIE